MKILTRFDLSLVVLFFYLLDFYTCSKLFERSLNLIDLLSGSISFWAVDSF